MIAKEIALGKRFRRRVCVRLDVVYQKLFGDAVGYLEYVAFWVFAITQV